MKIWIRAVIFLISSFCIAKESDLIFPNLVGIVLVDDIHKVQKEGHNPVAGLLVKDVDIPGGAESLNCILSPYFNSPLTRDKLKMLKEDILRYYQNKSRPFTSVGSPPQELINGTIQIVILESELGEIRMCGNRMFSDELFLRQLRICPKGHINTEKLFHDLAFLNRSLFHTTSAVFTQGKEAGTTDIELITKDRYPLRVYLGADNTGNSATENTRLFAGFNWGNVFGLDQTLSYQATLSRDFNELVTHTVHYAAPLPSHDFLYVYGGFSNFKPQFTGFKSSGKSAQLSMRYMTPILFRDGGSLELNWGADYKFTNNNLAFEGADTTPIISPYVNLFQIALSSSYGRSDGPVQWGGDLFIFFSPAQFLPHQSNSAYNDLRFDAKNRYIYAKLVLKQTWNIYEEFCFNVDIRGQLASANLLPSEEFGLGGYDTVRGYNEREINADNALCINAEIRLPPIDIFQFFSRKTAPGKIIFLGFLDYGFGNLHKPLPNQASNFNLLGVGPGLRYRWEEYLSLRLDYGYRLISILDGQKTGHKVHFGAIVSY